MQSLWLEDQNLSIRDIPRPSIPGEALLRVRLAGICGTDLELVRGYYPFTGVPGHEFVGEVVGSPDPSWIGKRVVGEINAVCGDCEQCKHGRPTHCEKRTVLGITNRDGVHAEYTCLPLANLHVVPENVSDEAAVFTEPLAAALEIQEQVHLQPTDRVLLIGAGRRYWDVVVEATGSPSGFGLARQAIRPRGTLVLKSTYRGELSLNMSPFVVDEITILGSRCGPFAPALRLLERGEVDPTVLIAERFPLSRGVEAYKTAKKPGILKVILT